MFMKNMLLGDTMITFFGEQAPVSGSVASSQRILSVESSEMLIANVMNEYWQRLNEHENMSADEATKQFYVAPSEKARRVFINEDSNYGEKVLVAQNFLLGKPEDAGKQLKALFKCESSLFKDPENNKPLALMVGKNFKDKQIGEAFSFVFI